MRSARPCDDVQETTRADGVNERGSTDRKLYDGTHGVDGEDQGSDEMLVKPGSDDVTIEI